MLPVQQFHRNDEEIYLHFWAIVEFSIGYDAPSSAIHATRQYACAFALEIWSFKTQHICLFAIIEEMLMIIFEVLKSSDKKEEKMEYLWHLVMQNKK